MKSHSKYRDRLTKELEEDEDLGLQMNQQNNTTVLSSQILLPEEQDVDMPDEKLETQLDLVKETNKDLAYLLEMIDPIIHDLRVGNLKRVAKSDYVKPKKRVIKKFKSAADATPLNSDMESSISDKDDG